MKKFLSFFLIVLLLASPVSFALQCKEGNFGSDECWTNVKVGADYTTLVSRGHILVASCFGATVAANDGFLVRLSTASTDMVLGVAQTSIASGETGMILVKGRGVVKIDGAAATNTIASNDALGNLASGSAVEMSAAAGVARAKVGVALEAGTAASAESTGKALTITAYIDTM